MNSVLRDSTVRVNGLCVSLFVVFSVMSLTLFFSRVGRTGSCGRCMGCRVREGNNLANRTVRGIGSCGRRRFGNGFGVRDTRVGRGFSFNGRMSCAVGAGRGFFFLPLLDGSVSVGNSTVSRVEW